MLVVPTDVTDRSQANELVSRTLERYGRLDVLVNNAGTILVGPVETMTEDDFRRVVETNFWGAYHVTMAALPAMRARKFGRIANISSIGGKAAFPHLLPYTVSKFALSGFTEGLRAELARDNILVTGVYPGTMRTGGHTHAWFKGNTTAEYTWFAASDTLPLLSVSAVRVADRTWRAICDGDPELVVGWTVRAGLLAHDLFPDWTAELTTLINKALPGPENLGAPAVQGQDLVGTVPTLLNRAVPDRARPGTV